MELHTGQGGLFIPEGAVSQRCPGILGTSSDTPLGIIYSMGILAANASVRRRRWQAIRPTFLCRKDLSRRDGKETRLQFSPVPAAVILCSTLGESEGGLLCRSPLWRQSRNDCVEVDRFPGARAEFTDCSTRRPGAYQTGRWPSAARDP